MSTQSTDSQREATPSQAASTPAAPTKAVQVKLVLLGTLSTTALGLQVSC